MQVFYDVSSHLFVQEDMVKQQLIAHTHSLYTHTQDLLDIPPIHTNTRFVNVYTFPTHTHTHTNTHIDTHS